MYVINDSAQKLSVTTDAKNDGVNRNSVATAAASLLMSMVETACEHDADLDLMRLVNFMDLYRLYLQAMLQPDSELAIAASKLESESDSVIIQNLSGTDFVSFERFVRDTKLLALAAAAASRATGERVAVPAPLIVSANHPIADAS